MHAQYTGKAFQLAVQINKTNSSVHNIIKTIIETRSFAKQARPFKCAILCVDESCGASVGGKRHF